MKLNRNSYNKKNIGGLIIVGILLLSVGGVSFAFFISRVLQDGTGVSTSVTTATIKGATLKVEGTLEFNDSDILPGHQNVSSVKVTATGNNELIPYNLIWNGTNTLNTPLNYKVYKTSEQVSVTSSCSKDTKVVDGVQQLSEECTISNLDKLGTEISSGTINKAETESKTILVKDEFITAKTTGDTWYYYVILEYPNLDEPQNLDMGGVFKGKVTVEESGTKPDINILAAYVIQDDGTYKEQDDIPQSGYTLNTEKSTCNNGTIPEWDYINKKLILSSLTKSGTSCYLYFDKYVPTASETILAGITVKETTPTYSSTATEDEGIYKIADGMYGGTSYYWRGAATTNHVIFAEKCWRIIRINGNGSFRLIYNGTVLSGNTCKANGANATIMSSNNTDKYYATSSGAYNKSYYVGWTYDDTGTGSQRTLTGTPSNAKAQTQAWYATNITQKGLDGKVADGYFCNDRNTGNPATSWSWSSGSYTTTWGATGTQFAYAAVDRVMNKYEPTLSCNSGDKYQLKVGAITADEVVMAGGKYRTANSSYYLYTGQNYWTMSPRGWSGSDANVFIVNSDGNLSGASVHDTTVGLRPVINLNADAQFQAGGDGTSGNPYVVE